MSSRWSLSWIVLALMTRSLLAATPILPLDQVKAGMKGYGRTVYHGTAIEQFDVTVLGVMKGFDLDLDVIMIRLDNGKSVTNDWGVLAGMSGSPIYVDGKLIGALAYGWSFQKEPVAGVTPIEQMLAQYDPQNPAAKAAAERKAAKRLASQPGHHAEGLLIPSDTPLRIGGRTVREIYVAPNGDAAREMAARRPDLGILQPVSTPLLVSGLNASSVATLGKMLAPYNLIPLQAGSTKVPEDTPVDFSPGAAVGVSIASGDVDISAIGTLTYADGDTVLAFGHPFLGAGKVDLPLSTAAITTIIASAESGFKLGGTIKPVGHITQDRLTCVGGQLGQMASTYPVSYTVHDRARGGEYQFDLNMARLPGISEIITVTLLQKAMNNVAGSNFDGVTSTRIEIDATEQGRAEPLKVIRRNAFDSKAVDSFGINPLWDLYVTLMTLRQNPFGEALVQNVSIELEFEAQRRFANIERAQASKRVAKRGEKVPVTLYLKPYGGESRPLTIPVTVPDNAPLGQTVVVLIGGNDGFALRPRINPGPAPHDVPSLVAWLNNSVPNDSVLAEMMFPTTGVEFGGQQLKDMPDPIAEALFTSQAEGIRPIRDVAESIVPTAEVIAGIAAIPLEIIGQDGRRGNGAADLGGYEAPDQRGGPAQAEMMMDMSARAMLTARRMLATDLPRELSWLDSMPRPLTSPERFDAMVQGAWAKLAANQPKPKPRLERPRPGRRPAPRRLQDDAPATDADKPDGPPDITAELKLKEPPKMPGWNELDQLEKGKLLTDGEGQPSGETGETADEGEDGPLARPITTWAVNSAEEFGEGTFDGTYPAGDGHLQLAPPHQGLVSPEAERAWTVQPLDDGSVLVGCWSSPARLYQVSTDGTAKLLGESQDDVALVAVTRGTDGTVYAGGIPSGRVYKAIDGKLVKFAELPEAYIWGLLPDGQGGLYAATGNAGRLYRIDAKGQLKVVLQSIDRHIIALCHNGDGVYCGTWPEGRVYRVEGDRVKTVFQAEDAAVLSLTATPNGRVYVGTSGDGQIYRVEQDGEAKPLLDEPDGTVYSLTSIDDSVYAAIGGPGRILRLDQDDVAAELYRTDEPMVLGLTRVSDQALVGTVASTGEVLRIGLGAGRRGTWMSPIHDAEVPAKWGVVRWDAETSGKAYVLMEARSGNTAWPDKGWSEWSQQLVVTNGEAADAPLGRYVQLRATLVAQPGETCRLNRVALLYRTLNRPPTVELEEPAAGAVIHKEMELKWSAEDPDDDKLTYEVYYAPSGTEEWTRIEAAKEDDEEAGDEADGAETSASADEDDADDAAPPQPKAAKPVAPPDGETAKPDQKSTWQPGDTDWQPRYLANAEILPAALLRSAPRRLAEEQGKQGPPETAAGETRRPSSPKQPKEKPATDDDAAGPLTESTLTWDTSEVPDGWYQLKVVARDEIRNPDDPKIVTLLSRPFTVDNTGPSAMEAPSPEVAPLPKAAVFRDAQTYVGSAEYRYDGGDWAALQPVDGIFDSNTETVKLPPAPSTVGEHKLELRVRDAAENLTRFEWRFEVKE